MVDMSQNLQRQATRKQQFDKSLKRRLTIMGSKEI